MVSCAFWVTALLAELAVSPSQSLTDCACGEPEATLLPDPDSGWSAKMAARTITHAQTGDLVRA